MRFPNIYIADEEAENEVPLFKTPSPCKKKKDSGPEPQRLDETPIRASLAAKLAGAKLEDENALAEQGWCGKTRTVTLFEKLTACRLKSEDFLNCLQTVLIFYSLVSILNKKFVVFLVLTSENFVRIVKLTVVSMEYMCIFSLLSVSA